MIKDTLIRSKIIKDPLFSSIKLWMETRLVELEAAGKTEELALARNRYLGLEHTDVQIEPPKTFPNGNILACFLTRKTGFFHADTPIVPVPLPTILYDLGEAVPQYTKAKFETKVENKEVTFGLFYLSDTKEYVVLLNKSKKSIDDAYNALRSIYWSELTLSLDESGNVAVQRSGMLTVSSINFLQPEVLPVYYINEDII